MRSIERRRRRRRAFAPPRFRLTSSSLRRRRVPSGRRSGDREGRRASRRGRRRRRRCASFARSTIVRSLVPVGSRRISEINRFFSRRARSVADLRPSFFAREQGVRASRSARSAPWRCRERWKPPGGRCGSGSGDETNGGSIEAEGGWKKVAGTGQLKGDAIKY